MGNAGYVREKQVAWGAVLAGFAIAAFIWRGRDMMNLVVTWVPQAIVIVAMLFLGARPAALTGAAVVLAGYLGFFHYWIYTYYQGDGLAWLLFVFTMPGAFVGGILATRWLRDRDGWSEKSAAIAAAVFVIAGIAVNQLCVWVMIYT